MQGGNFHKVNIMNLKNTEFTDYFLTLYGFPNSNTIIIVTLIFIFLSLICLNIGYKLDKKCKLKDRDDFFCMSIINLIIGMFLSSFLLNYNVAINHPSFASPKILKNIALCAGSNTKNIDILKEKVAECKKEDEELKSSHDEPTILDLLEKYR